jgi:transcriptional regulator with XRE-family HTH domain
MSQNSRGMTPLNWQNLVDEALRRRKQERLTQREHAALANVSIPTMSAFERAETTLTLAKAFDILRVVGLVDEPKPGDAHDRFVRDAFARWKSLAETLPADSPGRFPHGWFRFDYQLVGELKKVGLGEFEGMLREAILRHTGWPLFLIPRWSDFIPQHVDEAIECWLHKKDGMNDPAVSDFWRGATSGNMFLMRGYQEDGQETFPPGRIFDTALPIWRMAEALLHAERMSSLLKTVPNSTITVRFRAVYTGLSGRSLQSWSNPLNTLRMEGQIARSDEVVLETVVAANSIKEQLAEHLKPLVYSLYERFGLVGIFQNNVTSEIAEMLKSKIR